MKRIIALKDNSLPKLTPVEIDSVDRLLSTETTDKVATEPVHKKALGPDGFTGKCYHNFKN